MNIIVRCVQGKCSYYFKLVPCPQVHVCLNVDSVILNDNSVTRDRGMENKMDVKFMLAFYPLSFEDSLSLQCANGNLLKYLSPS